MGRKKVAGTVATIRYRTPFSHPPFSHPGVWSGFPQLVVSLLISFALFFFTLGAWRLSSAARVGILDALKKASGEDTKFYIGTIVFFFAPLVICAIASSMWLLFCTMKSITAYEQYRWVAEIENDKQFWLNAVQVWSISTFAASLTFLLLAFSIFTEMTATVANVVTGLRCEILEKGEPQDGSDAKLIEGVDSGKD